MDHSLLKNCLNHDFFEQNKSKLRASLFEDNLKELYETIIASHEKFSQDITPLELFAFWKSTNPTSTTAWTAEIEDTINATANAEDIKPEIAKDVIENLWRQHVGLDIANLGIRMSEGTIEAMDELNMLLDRVAEGYLPDDFGEPTTDDIYELLAVTSDENRWQFNIETLSRNVYGIGSGEFAVVFACPETGKSAFIVSLCAAPGGFCQQGAKVLYLGNEESTKRTKLRAIQSYTGLTRPEIEFDPVAAVARYSGIKDNLVMKDVQEWDIQKMESYIAKVNPDIVIVDQADKLAVAGNFNAGHERLRELYRRLRETAKKHDCALIGVSQASAEAENRTRLTMTMMEGSRVGKAAEADLIIGIGKLNSGEEDGPDNSRFLTVMKNKLSGYHGTIPCMMEPEVSRYVV